MFETEEFRITDQEIQLLRSKYCYKSIPFKEVFQLEVYYGKKVRNVVILNLLSFLLIGTAIFLLYNFIIQIEENQSRILQLEHREVRGIGVNVILILSLFAFGILTLIASHHKTIMMRVNKAFYISLTQLLKQGKLNNFLCLLKEKIPKTTLKILISDYHLKNIK